MRISLLHLIALAALCGAGFAKPAGAAPRTVMTAREDFDARGMTGNGSTRSSMTMMPGAGSSVASGPSGSSSFSLDRPDRFFMQQSYSLSAMSGPQGSASSGLYLNTLNYRFTPLMTAFVDVGFHTPIHSSMPGLEQGGGVGSLVLPRMGLEYRPSERLTFNFELVNGPDAWKAWGESPSGLSSSRSYSGSRIP